jgi:hypothetical protein
MTKIELTGFEWLCGGRFGADALKLYEIDKNPLYAWHEYYIRREFDEPIPDWVLEYFDRVASKLLQATEPGSKADVQAAAAEALELKKPGKTGAGTKFTKFRTAPEWAEHAYAVYKKLQGGAVKLDAAFGEVAQEKGVSNSTVRRAWETAKKGFPELSELEKRTCRRSKK